MRLDRAAHRAVLALGPQVEVDDDAQLSGRRAEKILHAVDDRRSAGSRLGVGGSADGLVQGDHVCVRRVRALTSAVATHRDEYDRGPFLAPPLDFLPLRDGEGSEDCGIRSVSDRVSARIDAAQQVAHRAARQLTGANSADPRSGLRRVVMTVNQGGDFSGQPVRLSRGQLSIIVEPCHGLGTLGEGLGNPPGVREHGREPVGGHARIAQKREVPVRIADVLGQDAEVEEAHVGVRPASQPRDKHREQVALNRRAPARPLGEGTDVRQRSRRIPVANRGQAVARAIRVQRHLVLAQRRGRGDDRAVEDVLVQSADAGPNLVDGVADRLRICEAIGSHRTPEDTQLPFLVRNQVRAAHSRQLSAVFDGAQEPVAQGKLMRVAARNVAALAQRLDRIQRRPHAQEGVGATVNKLKQLDGKLDVSQATAPELELSGRVRSRDVVFDATAHRARSLDESFTRRSAPHVGLRSFLEGTPDGLVSRTGARLEQRLELPGLRPFVPVLAVGLDGAHERSVAPLGT